MNYLFFCCCPVVRSSSVWLWWFGLLEVDLCSVGVEFYFFLIFATDDDVRTFSPRANFILNSHFCDFGWLRRLQWKKAIECIKCHSTNSICWVQYSCYYISSCQTENWSIVCCPLFIHSYINIKVIGNQREWHFISICLSKSYYMHTSHVASI